MQWLSQLQHLDFIWPWMLAALPLPWLIRLIIKTQTQQVAPLLAPVILSRVESQIENEPLFEAKKGQYRIPFGFVLLWMLLVFAAMRPVWYLNETPFQVSGKEMMLAVDLSGSMRKADMTLGGRNVDRLSAVKSVIADFIERRQGDRMGLVVFGSQAFLQSPLSYDLKTVQNLLYESEIGMAGNNTAMGDAIGLTLKHLKQKNQTHAVLILLTDGSNTGGVSPIEAAELAQQMNVKIYTIGVGQANANIFSLSRSDMDEATLTKIAELTDGQFFRANNTAELELIYQQIDQLEAVEHQVFSYRLRSELYIWPLGTALLLSFWLALRFIRRAGG